MPFFNFTAKNEYGETIKGKVEAQSIRHAALEMSNRGLLVINLSPLTQDSFAVLKGTLTGVKQDDVVKFTRQLATMITAGLPLANALSILVRQSKPELSKLVATILQDVEGGMNFSKALAKHPKIFSRLYIQLVNAGEAGGVLEEVLERLARNMEKDKEFRAKTKGALIYPVIVVIAMFAVALIMMVVVIPKMTEMYKDFGAELPLPTKILINSSNFAVQYWWLMLMIIAGLIFGYRSWNKTRKGQLFFANLVLRIPILGELQKKIILTEFARTMSLLLGAGISLLQAMEIVTDGVNNMVYREALQDVTKQVEKGISLSQALSKYDMFPPILHQMISVGEETGKLDDVLLKLSEYFEAESEQAIKNMTAAIEPIIMIVLGIGVGLMVIAVIMPIYSLTSQF